MKDVARISLLCPIVDKTTEVSMCSPVSSSGVHRELSAGASRGRQQCLDSESSRPCTNGMDAFCTNCTSSWVMGNEKRHSMEKKMNLVCYLTDPCTSKWSPFGGRKWWKAYLWFGVKLIRKHGSPCVEPAGRNNNTELLNENTRQYKWLEHNDNNTHLKCDLVNGRICQS